MKRRSHFAFLSLSLLSLLAIHADTGSAETPLLTWSLEGYTNRSAPPIAISTSDYGSSAAHVEEAVLSFGTGAEPVSAANSSSRQLVTGFDTGSVNEAIAADDYLTFTVTAAPDETFSINRIDLQTRGNGTGANWAIRSSVDGFASDLATFQTVDGSVTLSQNLIPGIEEVTTVEFRIYGYGMDDGDSVQLRADGGNAALTVLGGDPAAPPPVDPPNIVLILVDDMGYSDIGAYGSEIQTPHLDHLANTGLRFTHFYNHAKCGPTRAAIASGAYQQQLPGHQLGSNLAPDLNALGYRTLYVGKNHGGAGGYAMRTSMDGGAGNHFNPGLKRPAEDEEPARKSGSASPANNWTFDNVSHDVKNGEYIFPEDFYSTTFFTDKAVEYLENEVAENEPFFLYVAYTAPHWPLHALPEDLALYEGTYDVGWEVIRSQRFARQQALGLFPETVQLSPLAPGLRAWAELSPVDQTDFATRMATHAAMIHRVDQGIGRIVETLKQMGEYENTLFVFLSDNGATNQAYNITTRADGVVDTTSQTSYVGFGAEWCNAANTPFRGHKRQTYEGGSCTPFIMHWPGGIPAGLRGEIIRAPGHVIDLLPTFVELAGGVSPSDIEGLSLVPIIETGARTGEDAHAFIGMQYGDTLGLRMGNMKIVSEEGRNWGLFDMSMDPSESTDLSLDPLQATTLAALELHFDEWATRSALGVRNFSVGEYDGGPDQGNPPVPGDGGAITIFNVDSNGFDMAISPASDSETISSNLEYASYWSYRGNLESVQEILTFAEGNTSWSQNRTQFSIPQRFKRGAEVYGYVLVRDGDHNIAVYHEGTPAAIPHVGQPPSPGEITGLDIRGRDAVEISWTDATDDQAGLRYALYIDDQPMTTVGEALINGRLAGTWGAQETSAVVRSMPGGTTSFALVVIDSDGNAVLYPLADSIQTPQVELPVGAVSTYQQYVERLGSPAELLDPSADANGNGRSNFSDYALDGEALAPESPISLVIHNVDPFEVRFTGDRVNRDVAYRVLGSPDLDFITAPDVLFDSRTDRWPGVSESTGVVGFDTAGAMRYFATLEIIPINAN